MMKSVRNKSRPLLLAAVLAMSGCTTVVRENIISSINTGIGVSITENPQTQLYEARLGYIRSQHYSIPTGKVVENTCSTNSTCATDFCSNAADKTPEVVAGIRVNTGIQHLFLGADISENFAVGKTAVNSKAAVAMYVAEAKTPTAAIAASKAAAGLKGIQEFGDRGKMENQIAEIVGKMDESARLSFFEWADAAFPSESGGQLASKNDQPYFRGAFLRKLNSQQLSILMQHLTQ